MRAPLPVRDWVRWFFYLGCEKRRWSIEDNGSMIHRRVVRVVLDALMFTALSISVAWDRYGAGDYFEDAEGLLEKPTSRR